MKSTAHLYGPAKVGGDTLSYCTRCKMELAHVITSMVDGKPAKVECKTCRSVHRYKTAASLSPSRPRSGSRASAPKTVIRAAELWQQKVSQKSQADIAPYQTTRKFSLGDLLQHPNFGLGIVEELRAPNKISVLFREGEKMLIHAME